MWPDLSVMMACSPTVRRTITINQVANPNLRIIEVTSLGPTVWSAQLGMKVDYLDLCSEQIHRNVLEE